MNIRRACLVACLAAVIAAGCSNSEARKKKYFDDANAAFDKKDYAAAILGYRNVIKIDPRFGEARLKLAQALLQTGDPANAGREFIRSAELLPNDLEANLSAARTLIGVGYFEQARKPAERVVAIDPKHVEGRILLGTAIAGMKDLNGALKEIEEAIHLAPSSAVGYTNRAALLLAQGKKDEARATFEEAVKIDPKSIPAHLALASYHWSVGSVPDADAAIKQALAVDPSNGTANRAKALLLVSTGKIKEAEPFVLATVKAAGNSPEAELGLVDYYLRVGRADAAKPILERLSTNKKVENAANLQLARLEYVEGNKTGAYQRLDALIGRAPAYSEALVTKGGWLLAENRPKEALAPAQAAVKTDPGAAGTHFLLGMVRATLRENDEAKTEFAEVLKLNPRVGAAQTALAGLNLASGSTETAVQFARDALANEPGNVRARLVLVKSLMARQDLRGAQTELAELLTKMPESPDVRAVNGTLLLMKNDAAGARREYDRAIKANPKQIDALAGLAALDAKQGQLGRARDRIGAQLATDPKNTGLLMLASRGDLQAGDFASAEQRLRAVIELEPSNLQAYGILGQAYIRQRKLDEARKEFESVIALRPKSVGAHTIVGMLLQMQNKNDEAAKAYQRALEIDGGAAVAANNLANIYADRGENLDKALTLARQAADRLPDEPAVIDTVGWVYYKQQLSALAVPQFKKSIQKEPTNPIYHYHLGLAYAQAGDPARARTALEEALRLNPSFDGAAEAKQKLASLKG